MSENDVAVDAVEGVGAGTAEARALSLLGALGDVGILCRVDVRGAAAFLLPADDGSIDRLADQALRRDVLAMGRAHGFTHVAVIVGDG